MSAFQTAETDLADVCKCRRLPLAAEIGVIAAKSSVNTAVGRASSPPQLESASRARDITDFFTAFLRSLTVFDERGEHPNQLAQLLVLLQREAATIDSIRDTLRSRTHGIQCDRPAQHDWSFVDEVTARELWAIQQEDEVIDDSLVRSSVIVASIHGKSATSLLPPLLSHLGIAEYARDFGLAVARNARLDRIAEEHVWGFASIAKRRLGLLHSNMVGLRVESTELTPAETLAVKVTSIAALTKGDGIIHPIADQAIWSQL